MLNWFHSFRRLLWIFIILRYANIWYNTVIYLFIYFKYEAIAPFCVLCTNSIKPPGVAQAFNKGDQFVHHFQGNEANSM